MLICERKDEFNITESLQGYYCCYYLGATGLLKLMSIECLFIDKVNNTVGKHRKGRQWLV